MAFSRNLKKSETGSRNERVAKRESLAARKAVWLERERRTAMQRPGYDDLPTITDVFNGCSVFITGSTGFMGKVLIEKLLRSFPGVGTIYALIRPKKGKSIEERMEAILEMKLFDQLRETSPDALKKIVPIPGDALNINLGISEENQRILQENVSFVFHAAATVRFDDPLKTAVLLNTRGTRDCVNLARGMKKLKSFVHISTTYCNTQKKDIPEEVIDPFLDWRAVIAAAEKCSNEELQGFTNKIIGFQPNTYTFSKQLAEKIVDDARFDLPVIIARPSVVVNSIMEPMKGWIDNLYGPMGICTGVMKGVLRYTYGDPDVMLDYIPVDAAINAVIVTTWIRATGQKLDGNPATTDVINITLSDILQFQYHDVMHMRQVACEYMPMTNAVRYPRYALTTCKPYYFLGVLFSHVLFAIIVDSVLWATNNRTGLLRLYRTVHNANEALRIFLLNNFRARCDIFWKMISWVKEEDLPLVFFDLVQEDYPEEDYIAASMKGISEYVFKERCDPVVNRNHLQKLFYAEIFGYLLLGSLLLWMVYSFGWLQPLSFGIKHVLCFQ